MALTDKQRRFVEAYLIEPNGQKAAIEAGYSPNGAATAAYRLLNHAEVADELARRRREVAMSADITPEMVLLELAKLGFSNIRDVVRWRANVVDMEEDEETGEGRLNVQNEVVIVDSDQLSDQVAASISEVSQTKDGTLKVKMHDKLSALTKIGQHLGMFRTLPAQAPGKKDQANAAAMTAEEGSDWAGLLN